MSTNPNVAKMPAAQPKFVGVDDGYAYIKVAWYQGNAIKTAAIPSAAKIGVALRDANGNPEDAYQVADGETYTVGASVETIDTRFKDYPKSDLNRVLVHHALQKAGFGGRTVALGSTLPPGHFFNTERGTNERLIEAKKISLLAPVTPLSGAPTVAVHSHFVVAEAVAGYVDHIISDAGEPLDEYEGPVAVVDIGGRTTDIVVLMPHKEKLFVNDATRMRTEEVGVLTVMDRVRSAVMQKHRLDDADIGTQSFDNALLTGKIRLYGSEVDIKGDVDEAVHLVGKRILQAVTTKLAGGASVDAVLFIGGGAEIMKPVIEEYQNAKVHQEPRFANARGVLKILTFMSG